MKRQAVSKNVLTVLLSACSCHDRSLRLVIFNDSLAFPCWFRPVCKASSVAAPSAQRPVIILKFLMEQGISRFHIAVGSPWYQVQRILALSIINGAVTTLQKGINKDNTAITKDYALCWQGGPQQTPSNPVDRTVSCSAFCSAVQQCLYRLKMFILFKDSTLKFLVNRCTSLLIQRSMYKVTHYSIILKSN